MTLNTNMSSFEATNKQRTRKQVELQDEQRMEESRIAMDRYLRRPEGDNDDLSNIETIGVVNDSSSSLMNIQDMREMSRMYAYEMNANNNAAESIRAIEELVRQQQSPQLQVQEGVTSKGKNMMPNPKQKEVKTEGSSVPKALVTEQNMDTAESTRELKEIKEMMQQQPQQEQEPPEEMSSKVSTTSGTGKGKRNETKGDDDAAAAAGPINVIEEQNLVMRSSTVIDTILQKMISDPINVASTKARLSLQRAVDEVELLDGFRELMEAEAEQALYANGSMSTNGTNTNMTAIPDINGTTASSNIKQRRLLCPVCNRPCEQKEMDDFGKCSICRAVDLEDRTVLVESSVMERVAATESMYLKRRKERQEQFAAEGALQDTRLKELKQQQQQQQQLPETEIVTDGRNPYSYEMLPVTASTNGIKEF